MGEIAMAIEDWGVGKLVRLKCGGPLMVIKHVSLQAFTTTQPSVQCTWADAGGNILEGWFRINILDHQVVDQ